MTSQKKWINAGNEIRKLRKKTKLSVFKVARNLNITGGYLSQIECGVRAPSDILLCAIAEYYGVDKSVLFNLYNKLNPNETEILLANPALRKLIIQLSMDNNFNEDQMKDILKQLG
jgi:transcriptional regulator with XRE-family HTH domain